MPPRNQVPAKMSARSVYSRQSAPTETVPRGRGRPKKNSVAPKSMKSKILKKKPTPKAKKRKSSVTFKPTAEYIEIDCPEDEFSSEEEENTKSNDENASKKVEKKSERNEVKNLENEKEDGESNAREEDELERKRNGSDVAEKKSVISKKKKSKVTTKLNRKANNAELDEELESELDEDDDEELIADYEDEVDTDEIDSESDEGNKENDEDLCSEDEEEFKEENDEDLNGEFDTELKEKYDEDQISNIEQEVSDDDNDIRYSFPEPSSSSISKTKDNIRYSFPEPSSSSTSETEDHTYYEKTESKIEQPLLKRKQKKNKIAQKLVRPDKRKLMPENEDLEERLQILNEEKSQTPKKKIMFGKRHAAQSPFNSLETSEISSISPEHFNANRLSCPPRQSFSYSGLGSSNSLIMGNRSAPCGNIAADEAFRWLIGPTLPEDFYSNVFEKMPYFVKRDNLSYYKDLFNGNDINTMLKENNLEYGVHIDVVKYVKETRVPIDADGRAYSSNVWEDYEQGYSLRIRNPQSYNKNLWNLCSLLQEYFSSSVGVNVYLTPPKAQGFPPHYDDIDAFIVQVEGRKYWKVYGPRFGREELARYSSKDFDQASIGSPILEICLHAGDMLYIPRGYVHQAATDGYAHSLHLTFSTNQLNTWGDLLLEAAGKAVEKAILSDVEFRESIPKDYMDHIGSSVAESKSFQRYEIINKMKDLARKAMSYINVDEAADIHSVKFLQASLPPVFNKVEKERSLHGNGSFWKKGTINQKGQITQFTKIQLIKKRSMRLVIEDDTPRLYHNLENSRDPKPPTDGDSYATFVDLDMEAVPAYLYLLKKFPGFVKVADIPISDEEGKLSFATALYDNGLLMTKDPLPRLEDEHSRSTMYDTSFQRERY